MEFAVAAVERAMTYQQVIMRAMAGTWTWLKAADVLDIHPRSPRRWRARYEQDPVLGLLDRRRRRPSHRTVQPPLHNCDSATQKNRSLPRSCSRFTVLL